MNNSIKKEPNGGVVFGLAVIWVGLVLLLTRMGIISSPLRRVLISWPLLLTYIGIIGVIGRQKLGGLVLLIVGLTFLTLRINGSFPGFIPNYLSNVNEFLWPILIIVVGLMVIYSSVHSFNKQKGDTNSKGIDGKYYNSVFMSGFNENFKGREFNGATYRSTLGGMNIDLRGALVKNNVVYIDVTILLGGIELILPTNCSVDNRTNCILAGVEDKRRVVHQSEVSEFTLVISGSVILGGLEIKN